MRVLSDRMTTLSEMCYRLLITVPIAALSAACSASRDRGHEAESRHILYTSQAPGGTEDIRALDRVSGASHVVLSGDSNSSRNLATWSPDSRRVVFIHESETGYRLFIQDSLGAIPRQIGRDLPAFVLFPDWSPDGARVAVSGGAEPSQLALYIVDATTGDARKLNAGKASYRCPSWSPKGDRLVAASYIEGQSALVVLDTLGATIDTLAYSDTTYLDCPQWSPLGDEVLFTVFHGGGKSGWERPAFHSDLAIVSLSSRAVTQITTDSGLTNYPRWNRDGKHIVFQSDRHASPAKGEPDVPQMLQNLEIWVVNKDGSGLQRLTTNSYFDAHPSW